MGRTATSQDWVGRMHGLTVNPSEDTSPDPLGSARIRVYHLAEAIAHLLDAPPAEVAAELDEYPGGPAARRLADELADVLPMPYPPSPARPAGPGPHAAVAHFLDALRNASTAVYYCRRIQHPTDSCWFSVRGPGDDTCGHVLSTAHGLGGRLTGH